MKTKDKINRSSKETKLRKLTKMIFPDNLSIQSETMINKTAVHI